MPLRSLRAAIVGPVLAGLGAVPAVAIEPAAVAEAIGAALIRGSKAVVSYDSAMFDGDDVVIKGFTLSRPTGSQAVRFEEALIESPSEEGPGLFQTPRMTFTGGMLTGDPSGAIGFATASGVTVLDPAETQGESFADGILYETAEIRSVRLMRESEPGELVVSRVTAQSQKVPGTPREESTGRVEGLSLAPELFERGRFSPERLGYDALVFDVTWDSVHDVDAETMQVRDVTFGFRDGGDLSIAGTLGNLPDPRVLNDIDVLDKLSDVTLYDLTVSYRDNSFAERMLDLLADEQKISRSDYVAQMSAALPFLLAAVSHKAFRSELIAAIATFLQEPQSLTLDLQPDSPVSADEIASLLESAPGALPDRLGASVRANAQE